MKRTNELRFAASSKAVTAGFIARRALSSMKLRSKTACPCCNKTLLFTYGENCSGYITVGCKNCGLPIAIDLDANRALRIADSI